MFQDVTAAREVGSVGPYHSNVHFGERARGHVRSVCATAVLFFFFLSQLKWGLASVQAYCSVPLQVRSAISGFKKKKWK